MTKSEYLNIIEKLEEVKKKLNKLSGVSRTREVRTKIKNLKRKEKEYSELLKRYDGKCIEEDIQVSIIDEELSDLEEITTNKKHNLFNSIKRKVLSVVSLIGTSATIIAGGISFSASANSNVDSSVDNYYSVTQNDNRKDTKIKSPEIKKDEKKEEVKEENGIKVSHMDFDTFVYNSKFTIEKDADIYTNIYDVYNKCNGLEPYYENEIKREVKGVTINYENNLEYFEIDSDGSYGEMHSLLSKGGNVVSIVTSVDGNNYEGAYAISDVDLIYVNENKKVLKR